MEQCFFFNFRDSVYEDFSGLFNGRREGEDGEDYEEDDNPESYEEKKAQAFQKKWGIYDIIARLAEGDLLKIQQYYELPIKAIFNHLSYQLSGGVKTNKQ